MLWVISPRALCINDYQSRSSISRPPGRERLLHLEREGLQILVGGGGAVEDLVLTGLDGEAVVAVIEGEGVRGDGDGIILSKILTHDSFYHKRLPWSRFMIQCRPSHQRSCAGNQCNELGLK